MTCALTTQLGALRLRLSAFSQQIHQRDLHEDDLKASCAFLEETVDTLAEKTRSVLPGAIQNTQWHAIKTFAHQLFQSRRDEFIPKRTLDECNVTIEGLINPIITALSEDVLDSSDISYDETVFPCFEEDYNEDHLVCYLQTSLLRERNKAIWKTFKYTYSDFISIIHQELQCMLNAETYSKDIRSLLQERSPQIFNKEKLIGLALLICLFDTHPARKHIQATLDQLSSISSLGRVLFLETIKTIQSQDALRSVAIKDLIIRYIQDDDLPGIDQLNSLITSLDFNDKKIIFRSTQTPAEDTTFLFSLFFQDISNLLSPPKEKRRDFLETLALKLAALNHPLTLQGRVSPILAEGADEPSRRDATDGPCLKRTAATPGACAALTGAAAAGSRSKADTLPTDEAPLEEFLFMGEARAVLYRLIALYMEDFKSDFFQQCHLLPQHPQTFLIIRQLLNCLCKGYAWEEAIYLIFESPLTRDKKTILFNDVLQYLYASVTPQSFTIINLAVICLCEQGAWDDAIHLIKESPLTPDIKDLLLYDVSNYLADPQLLHQLNQVIELIQSQEIKQDLIVEYLQDIPLHLNAFLFEKGPSYLLNASQISHLSYFLSLVAKESIYNKGHHSPSEALENSLELLIQRTITYITEDAPLTQETKENLLHGIFCGCLEVFCDPQYVSYFKTLIKHIHSAQKKAHLVQEFLTLDVSRLKLIFNSMSIEELNSNLFDYKDSLLSILLDVLIQSENFSKAYQLVDALSVTKSKSRVFYYATRILALEKENIQAANQFLQASKKEPYQVASMENRLRHTDHNHLMYTWVQFLLRENLSLPAVLGQAPDIFENSTFASLEFFNIFFTNRDLLEEEILDSAQDLLSPGTFLDTLVSGFEQCSWKDLHTSIHDDDFALWEEKESFFSVAQDMRLSGIIIEWVDSQTLNEYQKDTLYYHLIHYLVISERLPTAFHFDGLDTLMSKITDTTIKEQLEKILFTYFKWNTFSDETPHIFINHLTFMRSQRQDQKIHGFDVARYSSMNSQNFSATCDLASSVLEHFAKEEKRSYHDLPHEYQVILPILRPLLESDLQRYWCDTEKRIIRTRRR